MRGDSNVAEHEGRDKRDDDDQSDEINDVVHGRLPVTPLCVTVCVRRCSGMRTLTGKLELRNS